MFRSEVPGWPVPSHTETRPVLSSCQLPPPNHRRRLKACREMPGCFAASPRRSLCPQKTARSLWLTPNRAASTFLSALLLPAGRSPANPHCSVFLTSARALLTTQGSGRHRRRPTPLSCTHGLSLGLEPQTSLSSGSSTPTPSAGPP